MRLGIPGLRSVDVVEIRRVVRTLRPALAGQRRRLVTAVLLAAALATLELVRPWPIKVVFDRVLIPGSDGWLGLPTGPALIIAAAATAAIPVLIGLTDLKLTVTVAEVGRKVTTRVRRQLFEHLHRLALPFHDSSRTGDLIVRLTGDVNLVRDLLVVSWINLLVRGATVIGAVILLALLDPFLTLLALAPVPLLAVGVRRSSRQLRTVTRKQRRREGDAAGFAAETLRQIRVVKAFGNERRATDRFARDARAGERAGLKAARLSGRMSLLTEALTGIGTALVLLVGAQQVRSGRLTPGDLYVVIVYTRTLYKPLRKVSAEGGRLSKAAACAGRIVDLLEVPAEPIGTGRRAPRFTGSLVLLNVYYTYPGGHIGLAGLSLSIPPGSLVVVAGPNGAGKSTLVSTLLRLIEPDRGAVLVSGQPAAAFELESYRRRFAYVPQDLLLFGATITENVLYGRPDATDAEVRSASRLALLDDIAASLPDGYDTVLGENGATLSGGEARRLMLARAAVRDAPIVLLDEPLAGIDPDARAQVARAIRRIAAGRTTLVVSHGPVEEVDPDIVVILDGGRVTSVDHRHPADAPRFPVRAGVVSSVARDRSEEHR